MVKIFKRGRSLGSFSVDIVGNINFYINCVVDNGLQIIKFRSCIFRGIGYTVFVNKNIQANNYFFFSFTQGLRRLIFAL